MIEIGVSMTCKYCGRSVDALFLKFYNMTCCTECHRWDKDLEEEEEDDYGGIYKSW